ncbi:putative sporulation protein YtxC [Effusibacillus pohliae]|uniref:putative sporulation protein YtxC n=1 Tax=Effusibacillus pohliae TaxID=232270 RepID=UPI000380AAC6|nr:putative sporulation protein YtxC [Effusibacillus pohliae]
MYRYAIGTGKLFDRLACYLERELQETRAAGVSFTAGRYRLGDHWYFTLELNNRDRIETVQAALAKALADFLSLEWERACIRQQIAKAYTYYDADEVDYLTEQAVHYLSAYRRPSARLPRRVEIELEIRDYLREHSVLNIEGMVWFRLRQLAYDRVHAIERAIDEYLMDREYQEFVNLLRDFLRVQHSRSPLIHLIVQPNRMLLVNHDGCPMTHAHPEEVAEDQTDKDQQQADMVISTLITMAPAQLRLHLPGLMPDDTALVETVKRVFAERLHMCKGCALCQATLEICDNGQFPLDYSK